MFKKRKPKILIVGFARSGKDTAAEILEKYFKIKHSSSSMAASEIFIFDKLKKKYGYKTPEECFEDRVNKREEWLNLISGYNSVYKARLAQEILSKNDIYVGMRSKEEIQCCKDENLVDLVIWIDAPNRVQPESKKSCSITKEDADIVIENNGTLEDFERKLINLGNLIYK